jgi:heme exporter protein C
MAQAIPTAPALPAATPAVPALIRPGAAARRRPALVDMPAALAALSGFSLLAVLAGALLYAPTERVQGDVQRIFYIHVPLAWVAYLAFFVVFVASIGYLWKRTPRWDVLGRSSAELGILFTTLVILTGSLWAKPIWGTWWSWDARLTTTLLLWLIYVAYLMVRAYAGEAARGARYAAVVGIVGFLDVPIIHQSVVWWRTLHPGPTVVRESSSGLPAAMLYVLLLSLVAFTVVYAYLLLEKMAIERAKDALARLAENEGR